MPGPFPGMDPYLENRWGDVHTSLTTYTRDQLQPQLPPGLQALVEEYVAVELEDGWQARKPDVRVVEEPSSSSPRTEATAVAVMPELAEELVIELDAEPRIHRTVHVIDQTSGGRLVTSIEFLSPWNKEPTDGCQQFRTKQREILEGGVNLVEVDLILAGEWAMSVPRHFVPPPYRHPYRICVRRANELLRAVCYKTSLRHRLPVIRIPLRPDDPDVRLDVQKLIDTAWQSGAYYTLNHTRGPLPPLDDDDAQWVRERLRESQRT